MSNAFKVFLVILFAQTLSCTKQIKLSSNVKPFTVEKEMDLEQCKERGLTKKILFIESRFCGHCRESKPKVLRYVKKYGLEKYFEVHDVSKPDGRKYLERLKINILYTPTMIVGCKIVIGSKGDMYYAGILSNFKK